MIAVEFPTIMSGRVVRWYADERGYQLNNEVASAGREGVLVHSTVDPEMYEKMHDVHIRLLKDRSADLSDVLTHRSGTFGSRDLILLKE